MSAISDVLANLNKAISEINTSSDMGIFISREVQLLSSESLSGSDVNDVASSNFAMSEKMLIALKEVKSTLSEQDYLASSDIQRIDSTITKAKQMSLLSPYETKKGIEQEIQEIRAVLQELKEKKSRSECSVSSVTLEDIPRDQSTQKQKAQTHLDILVEIKNNLTGRKGISTEEFEAIRNDLTSFIIASEDKSMSQYFTTEQVRGAYSLLEYASELVKKTPIPSDQQSSNSSQLKSIRLRAGLTSSCSKSYAALQTASKSHIQFGVDEIIPGLKAKTQTSDFTHPIENRISELQAELKRVRGELTQTDKLRGTIFYNSDTLISETRDGINNESKRIQPRKEALEQKIRDLRSLLGKTPTINVLKRRSLSRELESVEKELKTLLTLLTNLQETLETLESDKRNFDTLETHLKERESDLVSELSSLQEIMFSNLEENIDDSIWRKTEDSMRFTVADPKKKLKKDAFTTELVYGSFQDSYVQLLLLNPECGMAGKDCEQEYALTLGNSPPTTIKTTKEAARDIVRASFMINGMEVLTNLEKQYNSHVLKVKPDEFEKAYTHLAKELIKAGLSLADINKTLKFLVQTIQQDNALYLYKSILPSYPIGTRPEDLSITYDVIIKNSKIVGIEGRTLTKMHIPDKEPEHIVSSTKIYFEEKVKGEVDYTKGNAVVTIHKVMENTD